MSDKDWLARGMAGVALAASIASAGFDGLSYWRGQGQENLAVTVRRDPLSPIQKVKLYGYAPAFEDAEGIRVRWFVSIVNTSNATSLSVTGIEASANQFLGDSSLETTTSPLYWGTPSFLRADKQPVSVPFTVAPAEKVELEVYAVFSVAAGEAAGIQEGPVVSQNGVITMRLGSDGWGPGSPGADVFGNKGYFSPDGSAGVDELPILAKLKQPSLEVTVRTSRGYAYTASANWYSRVSRVVAGPVR